MSERSHACVSSVMTGKRVAMNKIVRRIDASFAQIVQALLHLIIHGLTRFDVDRTKRP